MDFKVAMLQPIHDRDGITIYNGDCFEVLKQIPDESIDAVVTDPPYGLSFMGKRWDYDVPQTNVWQQVLRVLKPGGHLLAFAGTRTQHRMAVNIEDAGFEIRDMIAWVYGSGFPKSLDVSKAIDKAAGAEREVISTGKPLKRMIPGADQNATGSWIKDNGREFVPTETIAATEEAKRWAGWGTALKPSLEPITMARKPIKGTVAANVLKYGTGAMNIDACRIETDPLVDDPRLGGNGSWKTNNAAKNVYEGGFTGRDVSSSPKGRWPANLIHDGSNEVLEQFPHTESGKPCGIKAGGRLNVYGEYAGGVPVTGFGDAGSAARFFYTAKADKTDRGPNNTHPTVKPTDLMRYLISLVCPIGGIVLDPYFGSGTTGVAAIDAFVRCIGIEMERHYCDIAIGRLTQPVLPFGE